MHPICDGCASELYTDVEMWRSESIDSALGAIDWSEEEVVDYVSSIMSSCIGCDDPDPRMWLDIGEWSCYTGEDCSIGEMAMTLGAVSDAMIPMSKIPLEMGDSSTDCYGS